MNELDPALTERAPWLDQSCEACVLMYKGWGGWGCCEVCNTISAEHTCEGAGDE